LPPGEPGEIVVSGAHVLAGYLYGQGDRETKFRVDNTVWHRTGDAGYFDNQDRLWLLGRCAVRIEDERGVLYPFAVEAVVQQQHQVKHCAFLSHRGKRVLAVELEGAVPPAVLRRWPEQLAWAHVDVIRVLRHMPVDQRHNAKIDYGALRSLLDEAFPDPP
jgi:acyl-CoA synthetase (AMP-forming)/AMP-acid ligase II